MGIKVEFNPDLALRRFGTPGRLEQECFPEKLTPNMTCDFLKEGQRNYWLDGDIPLLITEGNSKLSRPIARIQIIEATHYLDKTKKIICTKGKYLVKEVYDIDDPETHFEGFNPLNQVEEY